jgi:hypothetical protein
MSIEAPDLPGDGKGMAQDSRAPCGAKLSTVKNLPACLLFITLPLKR